MKSKRLSFNIPLFTNNIKRFWPVWAGYLFVILWGVTGVDYFGNALSVFGVNSTQRLENFIDLVMRSNFYTAAIVGIIFSLIAVMCVFSYIEQERSCYFMHSLPFTRDTLFTTNFLSGYAMLLIPNVLICFITPLICRFFGKGIGYMLLWLLTVSVCELFFYSFATFCAVITGQLTFVPVLYLIFMFYVDVMLLPVNDLCERLFIGVSGSPLHVPDGVLGIISPALFLNEYDLRFSYVPNDIKVISSFDGLGLVTCTYAVVAIILIAASFVLYKIRKSENSGDIIVFRYARPIFRIGVGFSFGVLFTELFFITLFYDLSKTMAGKVLIIFMMVVFCTLGYIIAEMLMCKSFRIFGKLGGRIGIFAAAVAAISVCFTLDLADIQGYVPEKDEILSVELYVSSDRNAIMESEEGIEEVLELHRVIIDNFDEVSEYYTDTYNTFYWLTITYSLKNGRTVIREYRYPCQDGTISRNIDKLVQKNQVKFILGADDCGYLRYVNAYKIRDDGKYVFKEYTGVEAKAIFDALKHDIEAGSLTSANSGWSLDTETYEVIWEDETGMAVDEDSYKLGGGQIFSITLQYELPFGKYSRYRSESLYYNKDCTNIIEVLKSIK